MNALSRLAVAFAAGAAAMYYYDPVAGRRRRALVRDKGVAAGHDLENLARTKSKRAADRMHGAAAETRAAFSDEPFDDHQLQQRIRSKLGRIVDSPGAVDVEVLDGRVMLRGSASTDEIEDLVATLATMRGVASIDNRLSPDAGSQAASSMSRQ